MHNNKKQKKTGQPLSSFAKNTLMQQFKQLSKSPPESVSVGLKDDRLDCWEVMFMGPTSSIYEGGFFNAELNFPIDFPNSPPSLKFVTPIMHPNVYPDGTVCISILHPPGTDSFNEQESADERWRPILGVEAVLVSVLSMLTDSQPNLDSPANIDAAKLFKEDPKEYRKQVRRLVRRSEESFLG